MHYDWCIVANAVIHLKATLVLLDVADSFEETQVTGSGGE